MEPSEFVSFLRHEAERAQADTGIPVEIMLAQAALETGWLTRTVKDRVTGTDSKNLFNIKGKGPAGWVTTSVIEYVKGRKVWQDARFRAYNSYEESFEDYATLIAEAPRYAAAMAAKDDPIAFAWQLQAAGYATDPHYARKVLSVMHKNILPHLAEQKPEDSLGHVEQEEMPAHEDEID